MQIKNFLIAKIFVIAFGVCVSTTKSLGQSPSPYLFRVKPGLSIAQNTNLVSYISLGQSYDSNVLLSEKDETRQSRFLNASGGFNLSIKLSRISLNMLLDTSFHNYIDDDPLIKDKSGWVMGSKGNFMWQITRGVSTSTGVSFSRSITIRDPEMGTNVPHNSLSANESLTLESTSGRLGLGLNYHFSLSSFPHTTIIHNSSISHGVLLKSTWIPIPNTAFSLSAQQVIISHSGADDENHPTTSSYPFSITVGYSGKIRTTVSVNFQIGYGNSFHPSGPSYNDIVFRSFVKVIRRPFTQFTAGLSHNFGDSLFGNFYINDSVLLGLGHLIVNRLVFSAHAIYEYRQYKGVPITYGEHLKGETENHSLGFNTSLMYGLWNWIFVGIGYDLQVSLFPYPVEISIYDVIGANSYIRHIAMVTVGAAR